MSIRWIVVGATIASLGSIAGVASGGQVQTVRARTRSVTATRTGHVRSTRNEPAIAPLVSVRLAAIGSDVTSPRGAYRARPTKIVFGDGLWMDHLRWVDWGQPVAYASGVVHAQTSPSHSFITTPGGVMLDQLRSCATKPHSYYTYASMLAPTGFPENTESTAYGESEQALAPC
jgi:hypothetical protein